MDHNVIIHGFHGTSKENSNIILDTKTYAYTEKDTHWLGQGVYFFREDPEQARVFAHSQTYLSGDIVILHSTIEVMRSKFLNLDTRTDLIRLSEKILPAITDSIDGIFEVSSKNETEANNKIRCILMDLIPKEIIKVIQGSFNVAVQPKAVKRGLLSQTDLKQKSVQICVRDLEVITKTSINVLRTINKNQKITIQKKQGKARTIKKIK